MSCQCVGKTAVEVLGLCDLTTIKFDTSVTPKDRNWTEMSIPELLALPCEKPDIEAIDKVLLVVKILSKKVIKTPAGPAIGNLEGTKLSGRKLAVEGVIRQKIVYTAAVPTQSVHSAHFDIPFSTFIVLGADAFEGQEYCVDVCVEDVFVMPFNCRQIFKNVTLFLRAVPFTITTGCS